MPRLIRFVLTFVIALALAFAGPAAPEAHAQPAGDPPTLWAVRLEQGGANRIQVVTTVRLLTGLGLKESNDLVLAAPSVVLNELGRADADHAAGELRAAGGLVTVIPDGSTAEPPAPAPPPSGGPAPSPTPPARSGKARGRVLLYDLVLTHAGPRKLDVVALVRAVRSLGVREAMDFVNAAPQPILKGVVRDEAVLTKRKFDDVLATTGIVVVGRRRATPRSAPPASTGRPDVQGIAPPIAAPPRPGAPPPPVKTTYRVVLQQPGQNKIEVIKTVRRITSLGVTEAKRLVDNAPSVVKSGLVTSDAELYARMLRESGAMVAVSADP